MKLYNDLAATTKTELTATFLFRAAGHGGFFNDLDLLQVGWGDFARPEYVDKVVAHLTMHVLLKSPLLISTYVSELSEEQVANADASCCTLRPRTTPSLEEIPY